MTSLESLMILEPHGTHLLSIYFAHTFLPFHEFFMNFGTQPNLTLHIFISE